VTGLVCTPLRTEYLAVRRPLAARGIRVERTGMGPKASGRSVDRLRVGAGPVLVAGVGGSLVAEVRSGEVVVATEVLDLESGRVVRTASPEALAAAVRRCGLVAHLGPVVSTPRVVGNRERRRLAADGALAADMESAWLAGLAADGSYGVLRVVVDTPGAPLLRVGTVRRGLVALRALRSCTPAIADWLETAGVDIPAGERRPKPEASGDVSCSGANGDGRAASRKVI
jgi:4-hydroxy-3-methylbut-2-enyl diphosphate reductase